jgi:AAA domain
MHLYGLSIEAFRSLDDQWVPADGLTVLFGPNSAGKTSVLEAIQDLLARSGSGRTDPGDDEQSDVLGSVIFGLPDADAEGSVDRALFMSLLRGEHVGPGIFGDPQESWPWAARDLSAQLRTASLEDAQALLAAALADTGTTGEPGDRSCVARALFDARAAYFSTDHFTTSMGAAIVDLPAEARDAAMRIAATEGADDDALWKMARDLRESGTCHLGWVASGDGHWAALSAALPRVIVLNGDIDLLAAELDRLIPIVHNRMWGFEAKTEPFDPESPLRGGRVVGEMFAPVRERDDGDHFRAGRASGYECAGQYWRPRKRSPRRQIR